MAQTIEACGGCGSIQLKNRTIHDGGIGGGFGGIAPSSMVCQECDWQGTPLLFEAEADWKAFYDEVHK